MGLYSEMLNIIILSKMHKKGQDLARINQQKVTDFNNLLVNSMLRNSEIYGRDLKNFAVSLNNVDNAIKNDSEANFELALNFVLKHEGEGLVKRDGIKNESSKFGILQSTAESFGYRGDIKFLTKEQAKAIYRKLWDKSNAANMPFPLSIVYFDTYVNSPNMAKKLLAKSNGNVEVFLNMREKRYIKLAEKRPDIFGSYLKGWKNRVNNLRSAFCVNDKFSSIIKT